MGSSTDDAAMSAPLTVLAAVQLLEADGYTTSIKVLPDGSIRCGSCAQTHAIKSALVDRVFRFEGASDPDDEAIVLGLRCPHCDAKSVLVSAFGPNAEPAVLQQLVLLDARFREE
jgi:hypothetical protein